MAAAPNQWRFEGSAMTRDLTNAEEAELLAKLDKIFAEPRFPFSARCRMLRAIRDKILPVLIAIALLAAAGAAQAQSISTELAQCLQSAPQKGQYSSTDGGQSALLMLLDNCKKEYHAFLDACEAQGGTEGTCNNAALAASQMALKLSGR
jgi:hypothetical protein